MSIYFEKEAGHCDADHQRKFNEALLEATLDEINILRTEHSLPAISKVNFEATVQSKLDAL